MATTLTELQIVSLFECLDIPEADGFYASDGMGSISSVSIFPYVINARAVVISYLSGIGGTAKETRLKDRLEEWDDISSNVGEMKDGGAGNASGLNYSFKAKQERIRQLVMILVPFYQYHDVLARRAANSNNTMSIPIVRA